MMLAGPQKTGKTPSLRDIIHDLSKMLVFSRAKVCTNTQLSLYWGRNPPLGLFHILINPLKSFIER
jgi:hypothetical protein